MTTILDAALEGFGIMVVVILGLVGAVGPFVALYQIYKLKDSGSNENK